MIKLVSSTLVHDKILRLTFSDGSEGDLDFAPILARHTELTRPLAQPNYFGRFFREFGALCWPNGLEFSVGSLHEKLERSGKLRHSATA